MTIDQKTAAQLQAMTDLQILGELASTSSNMKTAQTILQQGQAYLNLLSQETARRLQAEQAKKPDNPLNHAP